MYDIRCYRQQNLFAGWERLTGVLQLRKEKLIGDYLGAFVIRADRVHLCG